MALNKLQKIVLHEPKDVFDIYYLIKKKRFTPEKLLKIAKKKFGLEINLSLFWSESLLASKSLKKIKVLLPGSFIQQAKKIKDIQEYFQKNSALYLRKHLL